MVRIRVLMRAPQAIFIRLDGAWSRLPTGSADPKWAPPFFYSWDERRYYDLAGWWWGRPVYRERICN